MLNHRYEIIIYMILHYISDCIQSDIREKVGQDKRKQMVSTVKSESAGWAVGPLDFCAVAHVIRQGKQEYV